MLLNLTEFLRSKLDFTILLWLRVFRNRCLWNRLRTFISTEALKSIWFFQSLWSNGFKLVLVRLIFFKDWCGSVLWVSWFELILIVIHVECCSLESAQTMMYFIIVIPTSAFDWSLRLLILIWNCSQHRLCLYSILVIGSFQVYRLMPGWKFVWWKILLLSIIMRNINSIRGDPWWCKEWTILFYAILAFNFRELK